MKVYRVTVAVDAGPDKGKSASLEEGPLVVGSAEDCDLVLTDDTVSAHHCEISLRPAGGILLRDLGSTNGVQVNGCRVAEAFPEPGAKIQLGATRLSLRAGKEKDRVFSSASRFGPLSGRSMAMRALFAELETLAQSPAALLVEGETGTGKSVAAEAVHAASPRADGPLVIVDCGAVASQLMDAELFGHEKGAFTGAVGAREGLAVAADGGTLVLDEVGELPLDLQPRLLRLIERKEIRPVGANTPRTLDVRIICCTNRSLRAEVRAGTFREDLYYRLSALKIHLPALRERVEDLPFLVDEMLAGSGSPLRFGELPESDRAMFLSHRWPGNVRELRNVVDRLMTFSGSPLITSPSLPSAASPPLDAELPHLSLAREHAQDAFERSYVQEAMRRADGSISEAARLSGVSRQFFQRLLRKHGMR